MNNYSSPEVVEVGNASEVIRGVKNIQYPDNDGTGSQLFPAASVLDVD